MDLIEYLNDQGIKKSFFAKQIGVTPSSVSAYCKKRRKPNKFIIEKIAILTKGEVTSKDWKDIKPRKIDKV
jgi:predicted transcriptional regulator